VPGRISVFVAPDRICCQDSATEYDTSTIAGQFNDVHIVVQPVQPGFYRVDVKTKPGGILGTAFGPLFSAQIIPEQSLAHATRQTAFNADLACRIFHDGQACLANWEERLAQINRVKKRLGRAI
jgi:hypothetical protein